MKVQPPCSPMQQGEIYDGASSSELRRRGQERPVPLSASVTLFLSAFQCPGWPHRQHAFTSRAEPIGAEGGQGAQGAIFNKQNEKLVNAL